MPESIYRIDDGEIIKAGTIDMSLTELPSDQDCLRCGTIDQDVEVWTEDGDSISVWYPMTDIETGEKGFVCRDCFLIIKAIRRRASRCIRTFNIR